MTRKVPTGIFVNDREREDAIQLYGIYMDVQTDYNKMKLNNHLKKLAEKYGYVWNENEIAPNGEVIHVVEEKEK